MLPSNLPSQHRTDYEITVADDLAFQADGYSLLVGSGYSVGRSKAVIIHKPTGMPVHYEVSAWSPTRAWKKAEKWLVRRTHP